MRRLHCLVASCFGIGYIGKGGGTIASAFAILIWGAMFAIWGNALFWQLLLLLGVTAAGVWSSYKVEPLWGKDSKKVVIDEVAGMLVALLGLSFNIPIVLAAFVLFRFFDIVKPLLINRTERLPGGWGVMADDILSGVYSNIIMWILVSQKLIA
ncbi:MAG: phosphatidylglycerophosphatase A [Flavipsychrobacter sp.]|nr:phosphatidylglycerophosphatase A [Flavipsychrobacter sp.]